MFGTLGVGELLILVAMVLAVFGAKRIPEIPQLFAAFLEAYRSDET